METIKVSVIIPCYNQGHYLDDAVSSVLEQSFAALEIIVVNDGSTDETSKNILAHYDKPKTTIIHTTNQGLAAARNSGIEQAQGEFILPLDADDRIAPTYIEKAIELLESRPGLGIVYSRAQLFGALDAEWNLPAYSVDKMLIDNIIFCSACYRKSDWQEVGGYDPKMIYGWEDYDFWLSLIERGRQVHRIDEKLFHYRVSSNSMVRSKEKWQKIAMFNRIFQRHTQFFQKHIDIWLDHIIDLKEKYYKCSLYIDTGPGINNHTNTTCIVHEGVQNLTFNLRTYDQIDELRFDLVNTCTVVDINHIGWKNHSGEDHTLDLNHIKTNALDKVGNCYLFDHNKPQCYFGFNHTQLKDMIELTLNLTFHAFDNRALHTIVDFKKEQLTANKLTLDSFTHRLQSMLD